MPTRIFTALRGRHRDAEGPRTDGVELDRNAFEPKGEVTSSQPAFNTLSTYSDAEGVVTIGLPRAGWWGIAAFDIGSTKTYKGKALSQDAVPWIQARDMK